MHAWRVTTSTAPETLSHASPRCMWSVSGWYGSRKKRLPTTHFFRRVAATPRLAARQIRNPSAFSPAARMHRRAMTSGGLAEFFFLVTLARCCCGSAFFGPLTPPDKFAQGICPGSGRGGSARECPHRNPAELRQRRPAAPQLFLYAQ